MKKISIIAIAMLLISNMHFAYGLLPDYPADIENNDFEVETKEPEETQEEMQEEKEQNEEEVQKTILNKAIKGAFEIIKYY